MEAQTTKEAAAMTNYRIGDQVWIRHEQGIERGIIIGATNARVAAKYPRDARITVQFEDGTNSAWPFANVVGHGQQD